MFTGNGPPAAAHRSRALATEESSSEPPKFENTNLRGIVFLPPVSANRDSWPPRFERPHRSIVCRPPFRIFSLPERAAVLPGSPAATLQFHPEKTFRDAPGPSSRPCVHPP